MEAPSYISRLLQFDERYLQLYITPESMAFLIIAPLVQHAQHTTYIPNLNRSAPLLDYIVRDYGTVVPQRIWSPASAGDTQRYCRVPRWPIFFVSSDCRTLGIPLTQAATGRFPALLNGRVPAPVGDRHTTNIRIKVSVSQAARRVPIVNHFQWPGYDEHLDAQCKQIMIRDQTQSQNTICLETLAARVAGAVCRILDVSPSESSFHPSSDRLKGRDRSLSQLQCRRPAWRVGRGGVTANDIFLIGLIQVSQGSWQPILQLNRYIIDTSHASPSHHPKRTVVADRPLPRY